MGMSRITVVLRHDGHAPSCPQLQQLSLVSTDSSELIASDTPALQGKYNSITAILRSVHTFILPHPVHATVCYGIRSYVKQWRERSARETTQKPGATANTHYLLGGQGVPDQISPQKDEQ